MATEAGAAAGAGVDGDQLRDGRASGEADGRVPSAGRVRLHTLAIMRWVAVVSQLFTILFVHFSLDIELPLEMMLPAVGLTAIVNLASMHASSASARLSDRGAIAHFSFDIVQLCWLLAMSGGIKNPFTVIILLPLTFAASTLSFFATCLITGIALCGTTLLALLPVSLPWREGAIELPALYVLAAWAATATTIVLIAVFAWNLAEEARRRAQALSATQAALAREQQLSALGGQAAAAAHMLGSPLGTVNVIAKELVRELPADNPLHEEASELLVQAQRCREILASLSQRPAQDDIASFSKVPLSTQLEAIADEYESAEVEVRVELHPEEDCEEPIRLLEPELRNAFANLIHNAIQFAASEVVIAIVSTRTTLTVMIEDDGPGFDPEILNWLGEPYLSTRHGKGGHGLGIFIAKTLLARTGASLHFSNKTKGARVVISWPDKALDHAMNETRKERIHA